MSEKQYWYGHPRLMLNYEKKYKHEMERKQQGYWTIGAYVKNALQSTILMAGLADEKTANKLPKYPDFPKFEEEKTLDIVYYSANCAVDFEQNEKENLENLLFRRCCRLHRKRKGCFCL